MDDDNVPLRLQKENGVSKGTNLVEWTDNPLQHRHERVWDKIGVRTDGILWRVLPGLGGKK